MYLEDVIDILTDIISDRGSSEIQDWYCNLDALYIICGEDSLNRDDISFALNECNYEGSISKTKSGWLVSNIEECD